VIVAGEHQMGKASDDSSGDSGGLALHEIRGSSDLVGNGRRGDGQ
jgi:hypothetical protein